MWVCHLASFIFQAAFDYIIFLVSGLTRLFTLPILLSYDTWQPDATLERGHIMPVLVSVNYTDNL